MALSVEPRILFGSSSTSEFICANGIASGGQESACSDHSSTIASCFVEPCHLLRCNLVNADYFRSKVTITFVSSASQ